MKFVIFLFLTVVMMFTNSVDAGTGGSPMIQSLMMPESLSPMGGMMPQMGGSPMIPQSLSPMGGSPMAMPQMGSPPPPPPPMM